MTGSMDKFLTTNNPREFPAWLRKRAEGRAPGYDIAVFARPDVWIALADACDACSTAASAIERLTAENERLREALRPFIEAADDTVGYPDDAPVGCDPASELAIKIHDGTFGPLKVSHFREVARTALSPDRRDALPQHHSGAEGGK